MTSDQAPVDNSPQQGLDIRLIRWGIGIALVCAIPTFYVLLELLSLPNDPWPQLFAVVVCYLGLPGLGMLIGVYLILVALLKYRNRRRREAKEAKEVMLG